MNSHVSEERLTGLPEERLAAASALLRRTPAWMITAVFGLAYVIVAPPSADLAAATYRSELFGHSGLTLWDNGWYGGHHLLAYSVLAPALGWLIGAPMLAAVSMTIATALFAALIDGLFGARAVRIASIWFAVGAAIGLLAGRVPFDLGLAIGLGALLAARFATHRPGRQALALLLAVMCALASPVAGAFLALAALSWALGGPSRRFPLLLMVAALAPIAAARTVLPGRGLAAVRPLGVLPGAARARGARGADPL